MSTFYLLYSGLFRLLFTMSSYAHDCFHFQMYCLSLVNSELYMYKLGGVYIYIFVSYFSFVIILWRRCDLYINVLPSVCINVCLYICMYVCLSDCMSVCMCVRELFPYSAKTNGPIFKIQTPIILIQYTIWHSIFRFGNLLPI